MLLAGDIGGTKTDLALYAPEAGPRRPLVRRRFRSADYPSLEAIVAEFLSNAEQSIDRTCFDVAGPVVGGRAKTTNLPWVVDETKLADELGVGAVLVVNDLEAVAWAAPSLRGDDVVTLSDGVGEPRGTIGVIAPGTGLGESFLTWDGNRYVAHGSEGGHADFAPTDGLQLGLLDYMLKRFDHVSYEHVCSGIGIPYLYDYLSERGELVELPVVANRFAGATDHTQVIAEAAFDASAPSPLCRAAIDLFVSILAAEAGNLALKVLATGGLYIAGGIPVHVLPALVESNFIATFASKGRLSELLTQIPVHVITADAALIGAATVGLTLPAGRVRRPSGVV